jgi:hypothetical protein
MKTMDDLVLRRGRWDGSKSMTEFNSIGDDLTLGIALDELETSVGVQRRTNVETILGTEIPWTTSDRFGMDEHTTTSRSKRGLVEVKGALEVLPSRDPRIERCLSEEIESELSLRQEEIPKVRGKGGIHTGQDGKEVILESANWTLRTIATMHVRRYQLKLALPGDSDGVLVGRACLVVKDLEIHQ